MVGRIAFPKKKKKKEERLFCGNIYILAKPSADEAIPATVLHLFQEISFSCEVYKGRGHTQKNGGGGRHLLLPFLEKETFASCIADSWNQSPDL